MNSHLKSKGLTLVELMLVITVIALAILSAAKIMKTRNENQLIVQTAVQMNNVSQAVSAYYLISQHWPRDTDFSNNLVSDQLISQQALCTPLTNPQNTTSFCPNSAVISGSTTGNTYYYNIVLATGSTNLASRIAAQLANAKANNGVVTMTVTAPIGYFFQNPNQGWIVSAGLISTTSTFGSPANTPGTRIVLPNCPLGFEGHFILSPQRFLTSENYSGSSLFGLNMQVTTTDGDDQDVNKNDYSDEKGNAANVMVPLRGAGYQAQVTDAPNTGDYGDRNGPAYQVYYLTFCLPAGHWQSSLLKNNGQYGFDSTSTQCPTIEGKPNGNWAAFLEKSRTAQSEQDVCYVSQSGSAIKTIGSADAY